MSQVESQMGNLQCVDAKELGEVIDMIKDLEEAIYYCTVVEAMNKPEMEPNTYYYDEGRMMGGGRNGSNNSGGRSSMSSSGGGVNRYYERELPLDLHDDREGRSPRQRRMYMETKEMHGDQIKRMRELEKYMQELATDITEMIEDATPEEKQMLQKKIAALATKVNA